MRVERSAHPCVAAWLLRTAVAVPLIELMGNWSQGERDDEVTACSQPCVYVYVTVMRIHHMMHANVRLDHRSWKRTYASPNVLTLHLVQSVPFRKHRGY